MKCRQDNTIKGTGEAGTCVFCEHETGNGTPWPEGGVVCPCCITIGIQWRHEHDKQPEEVAS